MPAPRRLTVMISLDVMDFTRLVHQDERGTLAEIAAIRRDLMDATLRHRNGHIFRTMGDGALIEFPNVEDAVSWAVEFQEAMAARNRRHPDKPILIRAGIALADVYIEGEDRSGAAIASVVRLQEVAPPGGIAMTHSVRWQLGKALMARFTRTTKTLKGMDEPWEIWVWTTSGESDAAAAGPSRRVEGNGRQPSIVPDKPSLAVLPFQNISGDPGQEYFADGLVEELTAALSRVRSFFVMGRNSTFTYKGRAVDLKQVSRELGVRYVLEGSVRKARDRVRITAQLIDATTGNHMWSDRYDGSIEEIFDLQDRITQSVVGAIQPSILLAEIERTKRKRPESLDAYDCVLRAFPHVWALDPAANTIALNHLNRAIEIEPDYPLALSMAAWCQARQAIYNWTPLTDDAKAEGLRLATLAGGMSNDDPLVLTMLCAAHSAIGDLDIASALIEKALALDPNSAMAWNRSGWVNTNLTRPEIAIEHFQRALKLSPFDPMNFNCVFGIGVAHLVSKRYEEAVPWIKKCVLARPGSDFPLRTLAACLGLLGRISEAREVIQQYRQATPDATISKVMAITPYRDADFRRRYAEGLREAGLPE